MWPEPAMIEPTIDGVQVQGCADPAEDQGNHARLGKGDEEEAAATVAARRRLHRPHGDEHRVLSHGRRRRPRAVRGHAATQRAAPEDGGAAAAQPEARHSVLPPHRHHLPRDAPAPGLGLGAAAELGRQQRDTVGVHAGHSFPEDRPSDTNDRRVGADIGHRMNTGCCVEFQEDVKLW
jgi:hypothetical protein